jgi:glycosyltransferase involved in cell wall biosynthesis
LKYDALSRRIEHLNIRAADLLVVVSRPIMDEVVALGVDRARVLVNPNGVDTDRYGPHVDGSVVRERYGLRDLTVIGFIGTFGAWHGAEVLARAYAKLVQTDATFAKTTRLLMIGAGVTLPDAQRILSEGNAIQNAVFSGLVPQGQGAEYLAACDVLVSPHVPNPDGTAFFGSPTKLFEYMAMGKGIVASRLDQIGEVLEDGKTALLVPPGDVDALSAALARLAGDRALRECLGAEARRVAVERHTWREHTRRTIDALRKRFE